MELIERPDFEIDDHLRVMALQGDWGLRRHIGPEGGRWVIDNQDRARQACIALLEHACISNAHMALVPEMAVPRDAVGEIVSAIRNFPRSLTFIGGIEGLTLADYSELVGSFGSNLDVTGAGDGSYVNPALVVVKTPGSFDVRIRAKRVGSRAENTAGPPLAEGTGPFLVLKLGQRPFAILPLICAEFVWEHLWTKFDQEVNCPVDVVAVLQRNHDLEARHTSPVLREAYTRGGHTSNTRFVFANQAIDEISDGTCYIVVPPAGSVWPAFDHSRNELWHLPGVATYKGFRIPDRTGCFWSADIAHPHNPRSALASPLCSGRVHTVLTPPGGEFGGLIAGLMRSVAMHRYQRIRSEDGSGAHMAVVQALDRTSSHYVLADLTRAVGMDAFYRTRCDEWPAWSEVESVVDELVEAAVLLAAGGDAVRIRACEGGNCDVAGRPIALLYAPNVDSALSARFQQGAILDASGIPAGLVLLKVVAASATVRARRVGDVLRADRVTSDSPELDDVPGRTENSAVIIRTDDTEFCTVQELRPNLTQPTSGEARRRLALLFPKVYQ